MPKLDEVAFGLKTFLGAMTALFLAFWLGLNNPYWALATAYIVANPFTGPLRSKAVYRFFGTLTGAAAAVALVPNLVDAPLLLSLALSLWVGLCLYISLLDRTPRAYGFMLAGYTAAIIGFPSVDAPQLVFQTALTRVEEITLGIVCTTMFGTVLFPRAIGPVLARRIAAWVKPGIDWATAALSGHEAEADIGAARRQLAVEASDVAMMTTQLAYDTSHLQNAVRYIMHLRLYVLSLMPVLGSINDRVAELRRLDGITQALQQRLDAVRDWVQIGGPEDSAALIAQIRRLELDASSWSGLLRASLARRLEELVSLIHQGARDPPAHRRRRPGARRSADARGISRQCRAAARSRHVPALRFRRFHCHAAHLPFLDRDFLARRRHGSHDGRHRLLVFRRAGRSGPGPRPHAARPGGG